MEYLAGPAQRHGHGPAVMVVLSELDPDPGPQSAYQNNAAAQLERLQQLEQSLQQQLESVRGKPYIVFHDAYQYFERRFALTAVGSITLNPERQAGARRIQDIRQQINNNESYLYSVNRIQTTLIQTLIEEYPARSGVLDRWAPICPRDEAYFNCCIIWRPFCVLFGS